MLPLLKSKTVNKLNPFCCLTIRPYNKCQTIINSQNQLPVKP